MNARYLVIILWVAVFGVAMLAAVLCLVQGGFGGGHGPWDRALMILGLPWNLLPWPDSVVNRPLIWLVLIPFFFNGVIVCIATYLLRGRLSVVTMR
jgi:hypothetical protein